MASTISALRAARAFSSSPPSSLASSLSTLVRPATVGAISASQSSASTPNHNAPSTRRCLSRTPSRRSPASNEKTTHFGWETVTEKEKEERVAGVFHSVADTYDRMNDLMSFGWHRVWKDHFVTSLNPGIYSPVHPIRPQHILDVAGGTGDIAFRHLHHAHVVNANPSVRVTISDINASMLAVGRSRARDVLPPQQLDSLSFLEANAEQFPAQSVPDNSVDLYTVAFGIRNFTNPAAALREALRVLKPGGVFACLEFSKVQPNLPLLDALYQRWSFSAIPMIGQIVAGDRDSYQYLVESIQRFPSQEEFRGHNADRGDSF
jgi:2-methoxy-6-polyprenyl-1,4-benzoquinol methylase